MLHKPGAYAGRILKVDLTSGSISTMPLSEGLIKGFIGGSGINARLAFEYIKPGTPPLSPDNVLILGAGPLVGTLTPGAARTNMTSKSPVSGFIASSGTSHMGNLKFAGYDHLIVTGKASSPVYLEIGDEVRIRDAGHIWGKDTWESAEAVWAELSRDYAVATIGPAGENLVRDASVVTNKYSSFSKTGMGAVMGSKNLKAIAAFGTRDVKVADPKRFIELTNRMAQEVMKAPPMPNRRHYGSLMALGAFIDGKARGSIGYKNSQEWAGKDIMKSFGLNFFDDIQEEHGDISCMACPVGCKHFARLKKPHDVTLPISCAMAPAVTFGGACALRGWPAILKSAEHCNRLGMDHNSAGALVSMSIELYQKGIIDKKDTGGLELDWQAEVVYDLLQKIAYRKGFGNILADGLVEAPAKIAKGAGYYALHYKGIGCVVGDPRPVFSSWISTVVTNVIGHSFSVISHVGKSREALERTMTRAGMPSEEMAAILDHPGGYDIPRLKKWSEDYSFTIESLGQCVRYLYDSFGIDFGIDTWAKVYTAATGIETSGPDLLKAASRGWDMRKAFNLREGASRKDDTVPQRFLNEPLKVEEELHPPVKKEEVDQLVTAYYKARGWDADTGALSPSRLAELTSIK